MSINRESDLQAIVERANELISAGADALKALEEIAPDYGTTGGYLYQRIRMNGYKLGKQFVPIQASESADTVA